MTRHLNTHGQRHSRSDLRRSLPPQVRSRPDLALGAHYWGSRRLLVAIAVALLRLRPVRHLGGYLVEVADLGLRGVLAVGVG